MGKKLRGGSWIGAFVNGVFNLVLIVALIFLMMIPLSIILFLFGIYWFINAGLALVNSVIDGINKALLPAVKGVVNVINEIIKIINGIAG